MQQTLERLHYSYAKFDPNPNNTRKRDIKKSYIGCEPTHVRLASSVLPTEPAGLSIASVPVFVLTAIRRVIVFQFITESE